jgi:signal transduction histidine kinase
MKKPTCIFICIALAIRVFAQNTDTLSLKDRIFYHYDRSEFVEVVNCCQEALAVYESTDDLFEMAGCYNILGIAYQRLGKFKEATESYELCAETMERLRDSEYALHQEGAVAFYDKNIRYTRNNMAEIYFTMNEFDQAEKLYHNCIEMLGEPQDTIDFQDLALYLQNLTAVCLKRAESVEGTEKAENLKEAIDLAEQALKLSQQYDDLPFKHISKMVMLAQAYHAAGRADEALVLADEALSMAEVEKDAYLLAEIHDLYGSFEADKGHYQAAEQHYRQAAALATDNHFDELQLTALNGAYEAARHFDKSLALDYFEQSTALKDSIFDQQQQQLVRDYQVKYDLAEKEHQIALQEEKNRQSKLTITLLIALTALLLMLIVFGMRLGHVRKQQNKALTKLNTTKDHLFSVVSHDFKTSVMSQNLVLDVMNNHLDDMTKDDVKAKVLTLKSSSDSLKEKMLNLIEWMKVELDSESNNKTTFGLSALVDECISALKTEIDKKRLKVNNNVEPSLKANDDANIVRLIMRNLIGNAVKFSWPDGEINISATKEKGMIWVNIADHGIGISEERLSLLTKDLVTPSQGTQGETGSGLGLMLCKQLLDRSGGEITVESKAGNGTTVRFSINQL